MHPHLLHLRAALWSLNSALGVLHALAVEEAKAIAAEEAEGANDGIRSAVMGVRNGGGHGDPVAGVALSSVTREPRPNRPAQLADNVTGTLTWLADQLDAPAEIQPLSRLMALQPQPGTAATLHRWIVENDQRIRTFTRQDPHLWALPGNPDCPACRQRALYVQTAAPSHLWTVVCRLECVCSGEGCGCGMPVRVEGVPHIWDRTAPFVTAALTRTQ